jgi:N-acetyl-anhydromuramyl-L-alanine amidase AmpD
MTNINRDFRLTSDKYFQDIVAKTQVYIHHTVGGSALSTFRYWQSQSNRVATAYIIERDGTIYEVFDPHFWAWHLGLKTNTNSVANKQSIGIELGSEGALRSGKELNDKLGSKKFDENYLYAFDIDVAPFTNAKKLYHISEKDKYWQGSFRGYNYFDAYDDAQLDSLYSLVCDLCNQFNIPKKLIPNVDKNVFDPSLITGFSGVLTHCNVRQDKTDVHPGFNWKRLEWALK